MRRSLTAACSGAAKAGGTRPKGNGAVARAVPELPGCRGQPPMVGGGTSSVAIASPRAMWLLRRAKRKYTARPMMAQMEKYLMVGFQPRLKNSRRQPAIASGPTTQIIGV